jgi:hypothetical protein
LSCSLSGVAHFLERWDESNIPQDAPMREEPAVLLHVAYLSSQQYWMLRANIFVANPHLSALRLDQAIETAKKRGFA